MLPVPCKNDPDNRKFGNSPIPSRLHPTRTINFAREMIQYELMRRTEGVDRSTAPLLLAPRSAGPFTKRALDVHFKRLFAHVCTPQRLAQLSVHSFRVYCACALMAAGATPEQVMLLLRWSSESARKLYARVADSTQVGLLESAAEAAIDTVRTHSLLAAAELAVPSASTGEAEAARTAREAAEAATTAAATAFHQRYTEEQRRSRLLQDGTELLARAEAVGAAVPATELRRRGIVIDDDHVYTRLQRSADALHSAAERFDAEVAKGAESEGDSDDDAEAEAEGDE